MLGYIVPDRPELKIREFELYKAYYCGICKSIARRYGQLPRLVLSYDSVFLALILSGLNDKLETVKTERCIVHPLKKRNIAYDNKEIDYAADMLLLLAYYKMKDDIIDEKKLKAIVGEFFMRSTMSSLEKSEYEKCRYVKEQLDLLVSIENEVNISIDASAEPFAKLMEEIFDYSKPKDIIENSDSIKNKDSSTKENDNDTNLQYNLRRIGYHVGKWIYLIDAYDDIEENITKRTFNPLIIQFKYNKDNETIPEFKDRIKERVERNLLLYLAEISNTCEKIEIKKNKDLIENIIYFGLLRKTEEVLGKGKENNAESI